MSEAHAAGGAASFEIWTAHRYGHQFGQPENRVADGLSKNEVAAQLRHLRDTSILLHNVLVVHEAETWRGNKWLEQFEKENQ